MCSISAIITYLKKMNTFSPHWANSFNCLMTNIHGLNCNISMCIHYVYTLCISFSLGQTASFKKKIFFFFGALWRICLKGIFFMNKGFDAYSFLCEMGSSVPWGKLHSENQSSCDPLCVFFLNLYYTSWILLNMFVICRFV